MAEKTYRVQEIFKWFNQFEKMDIKIQGKSKEFDIEMSNKYLPHLLGLHYINKNPMNISSKILYNYIKENNISY